MAKHFDLIGGKLIAGDSTKLRAQNSKKNNYKQKTGLFSHPIILKQSRLNILNPA